MNDAENLSKLLGHLSPAVFREFMVTEFGLAMPDLDKKQGKQEQRAVMEPVLSALDLSARRLKRACQAVPAPPHSRAPHRRRG